MDIIDFPVWTGTLKDSAAVLMPMAFTVDELACTAQSLNDPLHVGWYTMVVQLFDVPLGPGSEVLSTGAAAAVRIAAVRQTHGDLFLHAVQGFGQIDLQLELDFNDPLVLTPSVPFGALDVYEGGASAFSVTADETCSSIYYLRGQQVGVDGYTLSSNDLIEGEAYRLDVVAFNTDGSRAASGTWNVTARPFDPELVMGSFISGVAGDYRIRLMIMGQPATEQNLFFTLPADTLQSFQFTGLTPATYIMGVRCDTDGSMEWWENTSDTTPFAVPLVAPTIFDFGTLDF